MAYVAITASLKSAIKDRLMEVRNKETDAQLGEKPDTEEITAASIRGILEQRLWGEHEHLKGALPEAWLGDCKHLYIEVDGVRITLRDPESLCYPPGTNYSATLCFQSCDELQHPEVSAYVGYCKAVGVLTQKYDSLWKQLREFLDKCSSLNAAVKLYPDLMLFVPEDVKERLARKLERVNRGNPDEMLKGVDTAALTSAGVANVLRDK